MKYMIYRRIKCEKPIFIEECSMNMSLDELIARVKIGPKYKDLNKSYYYIMRIYDITYEEYTRDLKEDHFRDQFALKHFIDENYDGKSFDLELNIDLRGMPIYAVVKLADGKAFHCDFYDSIRFSNKYTIGNFVFNYTDGEYYKFAKDPNKYPLCEVLVPISTKESYIHMLSYSDIRPATIEELSFLAIKEKVNLEG